MKKIFSFSVLGLVLFLAAAPSRGLALTAAEINAQIQALLAQVQQLQESLNVINGVSSGSGLNSALSSGVVSGDLVSGDSIRVVYALGANVRETPGLSGKYITTKSYFSAGKVIGQPVSADGLTWWKVDFEIPPGGWVAEKNQLGNTLIAKYTPPPPITTDPGTGTGTSNSAPVLGAVTQTVTPVVGSQGSWQVSATDANSDSLTYTANWGDGTTPTSYNGSSGQVITMTHTYTQAGARSITVTVSDGKESVTGTPFPVIFGTTPGTTNPPTNGTQGPSSQISGPQTAVSGVATSWQFIAYDPDSPSISFVINWGDGASSNFSSAPGVAKMMDHTYSQTGNKTISVVATDNTGLTHGSSWGINVTTADLATAKPSVPVVTGPTQVTVGVNTTWTVTLNDPDTNSLTYTINWNDGSAIENGTATRGVPFTISHIYKTLFTGYKSIVVNVSDGTNTEWTTKNITSKLPNQAPTIGSVSGPMDVKTATTRTWYITGTDPEGAVVDYTFNWGDGTSNSYTAKASGVSFGASHIYQKSGTFIINVTVKDNGGLSAASSDYSVRANKFAVNDRVEVLSTLTVSLAVRATPSPTGVYIGGVYSLSKNGSKGTILEGPVVAGGYTWWKVAWDATMTGWSAEDWLVKTN